MADYHRVYEAAFGFKKTQLWKKLYDSQLFALRFADGGIGYCCVMGKAGRFTALAVYPGSEGLESYRRMSAADLDADEFDKHEIMLSQNCLMCSFESKDDLHPEALKNVKAYCAKSNISPRGANAYPNLIIHKPEMYPWPIREEEDIARLSEALDAGVEVARRMQNVSAERWGFTEGTPYDRDIPLLEKQGDAYGWSALPLPEPQAEEDYPAPRAIDELALGRVKRSKKKSGVWGCDVLLHTEPVSNDQEAVRLGKMPDQAPYFPRLMIIVDCDTGNVINMSLSKGTGDYADQFAPLVLDTAKKEGRPQTILVKRMRALSLFSPLAEAMGTDIVFVEDIPALDEAEADYANAFGQGEEDGAGVSDFELDQLAQFFEDKEAIKSVPDSILEEMLSMSALGILRDEWKTALLKERERRKSRR